MHPDDEALLQEEAPKPINSKRLKLFILKK